MTPLDIILHTACVTFDENRERSSPKIARPINALRHCVLPSRVCRASPKHRGVFRSRPFFGRRWSAFESSHQPRFGRNAPKELGRFVDGPRRAPNGRSRRAILATERAPPEAKKRVQGHGLLLERAAFEAETLRFSRRILRLRRLGRLRRLSRDQRRGSYAEKPPFRGASPIGEW